MPDLNFTEVEMLHLLDLVDRAAEDFEYASSFEDNGYTPEDVENFWLLTSAVRGKLNA